MDEIKIICNESGIRIDTFIADSISSCSRTYVKKLLDDGCILVNDKIVKSNYRTKLNDEIIVNIPEPEELNILPEKLDIPILYEDNDIVIVNKPKGMVVHPSLGHSTNTLVNGLLAHCKDDLSNINGVKRPGIVHRIDKDTSGILVVAKNNIAHENLCEKLKIHDIKRVYVAIVEGVIRVEQGTIDAPIGRHSTDRKKMAVNIKNGKSAVSHFKVLERLNNATYIEVTLETGRTHQIRVHMSYIGYPIIGDVVYGRNNSKYNLEGQTLHAKLLGFNHPISGEYVEFEVNPPKYFEELLNQIRTTD